MKLAKACPSIGKHCVAMYIYLCKRPYSGFCLQGSNYASSCRLANFNSAVTLVLSFQLTAHVTVLCL